MGRKLIDMDFPYKPPPSIRHQKEIENPLLYPLVNIQLYTENGRPFNIEGLLDSGADTVFIPKGIAEGLKLPKLSEITSSGVLSSGICYKTKVGLILGRTKSRRVDFGYIDAVFPSTEGDIPLLIGRQPIFDIFQVTFEQYKEPPSVHLKQIRKI
jgi:hypothetical protein